MRRGANHTVHGVDFRGNESRSFRKQTENYSNLKYSGAIPPLSILRLSSGHHTVESEHSIANFVYNWRSALDENIEILQILPCLRSSMI